MVKRKTPLSARNVAAHTYFLAFCVLEPLSNDDQQTLLRIGDARAQIAPRTQSGVICLAVSPGPLLFLGLR